MQLRHRAVGLDITGGEIRHFYAASPEDRARRRFDELRKRGQEADYDTVLRDIILRDEHDTRRSAAPLRQAEDAVCVDTSDMTIEEVVAAIKQLAAEKSKEGNHD